MVFYGLAGNSGYNLEYREGVEKAYLTFKYQRVWCPNRKKMVSVCEWPDMSNVTLPVEKSENIGQDGKPNTEATAASDVLTDAELLLKYSQREGGLDFLGPEIEHQILERIVSCEVDPISRVDFPKMIAPTKPEDDIDEREKQDKAKEDELNRRANRVTEKKPKIISKQNAKLSAFFSQARKQTQDDTAKSDLPQELHSPNSQPSPLNASEITKQQTHLPTVVSPEPPKAQSAFQSGYIIKENREQKKPESPFNLSMPYGSEVFSQISPIILNPPFKIPNVKAPIDYFSLSSKAQSPPSQSKLNLSAAPKKDKGVPVIPKQSKPSPLFPEENIQTPPNEAETVQKDFFGADLSAFSFKPREESIPQVTSKAVVKAVPTPVEFEEPLLEKLESEKLNSSAGFSLLGSSKIVTEDQPRGPQLPTNHKSPSFELFPSLSLLDSLGVPSLAPEEEAEHVDWKEAMLQDYTFGEEEDKPNPVPAKPVPIPGFVLREYTPVSHISPVPTASFPPQPQAETCALFPGPPQAKSHLGSPPPFRNPIRDLFSLSPQCASDDLDDIEDSSDDTNGGFVGLGKRFQGLEPEELDQEEETQPSSNHKEQNKRFTGYLEKKEKGSPKSFRDAVLRKKGKSGPAKGKNSKIAAETSADTSVDKDKSFKALMERVLSRGSANSSTGDWFKGGNGSQPAGESGALQTPQPSFAPEPFTSSEERLGGGQAAQEDGSHQNRDSGDPPQIRRIRQKTRGLFERFGVETPAGSGASAVSGERFRLTYASKFKGDVGG